jgi:hypothetical protein
MRTLLAVLVLAAVAFGACSQSLTGSMSGTGGSGTGGLSMGAGGEGGSYVSVACDNLVSQYQAAVIDAQTCDVGQSGQCDQLVDVGLSSCGACQVYVNDASKPKAIQQAWFGAGCNQLPGAPCTHELCISPLNNMCLVVLDTNHGTCGYAPPGTGGSSADGGLGTCDSLVQKYAAAVSAAKSCTAGAGGQCGTIVPGELSVCMGLCSVFVNDATELYAIRQQWTDAGCANVTGVCSMVICQPAIAGSCAAADGGGPSCATAYGAFQ